MSALFHLIEPGEILDHSDIARRVNADRFCVTDAVFDAVSLADSAASFFRGMFPIETPHFMWGDLIYLPWHTDYWTKSDDGQSFSPRSIRDESLCIAQELLEVAGTQEEGNPWPQVTFGSTVLTKSEKLVMQGLAVEVMLSVDGFLSHVSGGYLPESLSWFAAAYKNTIECTCQAQQILGYASTNARKAAFARHRENHEMKAQVWKWYSEHKEMYPSMDKAAEALVASVKLVPVSFRTARAWIGEWVRDQRSARRP